MGRMGKTSEKISRAKIEAIATAIATGKSLSAAAELCGITRTTALNWRDKGYEAQKGLYREFYEEITAAKRRHEQSLLDKMKTFSEEGEILRKTKRTTSPDGSVTVTQEVTEGKKYEATKWLLEKRFYYDRLADRAAAKVMNTMVKIAEKTLPPDDLDNYLSAVLRNDVLGMIASEEADRLLEDDERD
jgi:transposase-like protein